mgnify:CR=1 FL=1
MIKVLGLTIYTNYRDFVCDSADIPNLPHDVADGSTAITSDTGREFVYHKKEDAWKQEKRPTPPFVWLGEYLSLMAISDPAYGALTSVRDETGRRLYWFNGIKWVEMVTKED